MTRHYIRDVEKAYNAASIHTHDGDEFKDTSIHTHEGEGYNEREGFEHNLMNPPTFNWPSIKEYFESRLTELLPSKTYILEHKSEINPFPALKEINGKQWLFILVAFAGWTWDAFDFFTISLNVSELAKELHRKTTDITWAITLVLMLRSVGAIIFGVAADKFGTKWPFVINMIAMLAVQLGLSFITTFKQFLGVRALFGVVMGGVYGNAAATAMSDCPVRARGFISGFLQQGYAFGYLLAVIFTRAIADTQSHGWKACYWFAAGVTFLIALARVFLPETDAFIHARKVEEEKKANGEIPEGFFTKARKAMKTYWLICIYLVLLMAGFNFMSHGSQDLFPTMLTNQLEFSHDRSTVTNCVANLGAIAGGFTIGHFSQFIGRRLSIMICCVCGGALVYPWGFVHNNGINAAAFFLQFFVQGAFGVIPAHLSELAHPEFKVIIVGLAYQLGNLASSASSTIESELGKNYPLYNSDGTLRVTAEGNTIYNYGKVMAIFMGAVFGFNLLISFIGPENSAAKRIIATRRNGTVDDDKLSVIGSGTSSPERKTDTSFTEHTD